MEVRRECITKQLQCLPKTLIMIIQRYDFYFENNLDKYHKITSEIYNLQKVVVSKTTMLTIHNIGEYDGDSIFIKKWCLKTFKLKDTYRINANIRHIDYLPESNGDIINLICITFDNKLILISLSELISIDQPINLMDILKIDYIPYCIKYIDDYKFAVAGNCKITIFDFRQLLLGIYTTSSIKLNILEHNDTSTIIRMEKIDNKYLVTAKRNGLIEIWDLEDGKIIKTIKFDNDGAHIFNLVIYYNKIIIHSWSKIMGFDIDSGKKEFIISDSMNIELLSIFPNDSIFLKINNYNCENNNPSYAVCTSLYTDKITHLYNEDISSIHKTESNIIIVVDGSNKKLLIW